MIYTIALWFFAYSLVMIVLDTVVSVLAYREVKFAVKIKNFLWKTKTRFVVYSLLLGVFSWILFAIVGIHMLSKEAQENNWRI